MVLVVILVVSFNETNVSESTYHGKKGDTLELIKRNLETKAITIIVLRVFKCSHLKFISKFEDLPGKVAP